MGFISIVHKTHHKAPSYVFDSYLLNVQFQKFDDLLQAVFRKIKIK